MPVRLVYNRYISLLPFKALGVRKDVVDVEKIEEEVKIGDRP